MQRRRPLTLLCSASLLCAIQASANDAHQKISGPFASPMEVTQKCLECHADEAHDVMQTSHWTWELEQEISGNPNVFRGKKNAINNFCISINGNWPRCTSCHVGYGWKDASFDFSDQNRIDCLVCHDTTATYQKPGPGAGMPAGFTGNAKLDKTPVDLTHIARNAGLPSRRNCISCHGYGGGGNNVKHGDIDSSMVNPEKNYDVHMSRDGADFSCQGCHTTENHRIKGNAMVVSPGGRDHIACTDCHDKEPHKESILNSHMDTVACQTCHIPTFAKEMPTKMTWDWSTAGEDRITEEHDAYGKLTYDKKKGDFTWGKNVVPTYAWYNGKGGAYLLGNPIDPEATTRLSWPEGDRSDPTSKIYPFKVHKGMQIYDKKHNYLITPKVFGTRLQW